MVVLRAEKWVHGGYTIAHANGKTYFIKGAIPNEEVECEILKENSKVTHVRVTKVLKESQERVPSDCKVFPICGGCSFRHISYEKELELKKSLLLEEFNRKNIFFAKDVLVIHSKPTEYRNNFQIKFADHKYGFFQDFSNDIVELPLDGCKNLTPSLNQIINSENLKYSRKWRELSKVYPYDKEEGEYHFENIRLIVPQNGFFQVNSHLIPKWLRKIQSLTAKKKRILELFSGCGLISLAISENCESLLGLELDRNSVRYAKKNAISNKKTNLKFEQFDLYKKEISYSNFEVLLCNPPRAGLGKKVLNWISQNLPAEILYSSCNYLTLSFDLQKILELNYKLETAEIFDFFPRTPYFETLILLKRAC
ncbi:MAG: methyltransferase [Leptospiraceae bacterium]|nr:methyltransferase [Leptospiraceae bacterium]